MHLKKGKCRRGVFDWSTAGVVLTTHWSSVNNRVLAVTIIKATHCVVIFSYHRNSPVVDYGDGLSDRDGYRPFEGAEISERDRSRLATDTEKQTVQCDSTDGCDEVSAEIMTINDEVNAAQSVPRLVLMLMGRLNSSVVVIKLTRLCLHYARQNPASGINMNGQPLIDGDENRSEVHTVFV